MFLIHFYKDEELQSIQMELDIDEALNKVVEYDEEDSQNKAELFEV